MRIRPPISLSNILPPRSRGSNEYVTRQTPVEVSPIEWENGSVKGTYPNDLAIDPFCR
jgi:hypothetical protein